MVKKVFPFKSNIGRSEYILSTFLMLGVLFIGIVINNFKDNLNAALILIFILSLCFFTFQSHRRLNDLNMSYWYILLLLVPIVNFILIIILVFKPGKHCIDFYGSSFGFTFIQEIQNKIHLLIINYKSPLISKSLLFNKKLIQNVLHVVRYYWPYSISVIVGILLGWNYRKPNNKLLGIAGNFDSLWKKDLVIEYLKNQSSYFSSEYFSFNWPVFLISLLLCFLIILFFNDKAFRKYLLNKFSFTEEKKSL